MFYIRQLTTSIIVLVLVTLTSFSLASIENKPFRVTHRNSGPRYDIDEVERTKLAPETHSNEQPMMQPGFNRPSSEVSEHDTPFGHATVRRIFLVPMMPAAQSGDSSLWSRSHSSDRRDNDNEDSNSDGSTLFSSSSNRPFWPFLPSAPRHHLFGADEASKPQASAPEASTEIPKVERQQPAATGEREDAEAAEAAEKLRPLFDPIQMMLQLMQQALNPASQSQGNNFFKDLSKDASSSADVKPNEATPNGKPTDSVSPFEAKTNNETREDIVEIDGKKFMRKTIINRHVGDHIIFMTKRLIFVPLNETEQDQGKDTAATTTTTTTTTTTEAPTTFQAASDTTTSSEPINSATSTPEIPNISTTAEAKRQLDEVTTTVASAPIPELTTSFVDSAPPSTTASKPEAPPSTTTSKPEVEEATTTVTAPKEPSWTDRVSEAIDKAAERIVEAGSIASTTGNPRLI